MFEAFEVIRDAEMRQYTTLRLGGKADWLAFPRNAEEIAALYAEAGQAGLPVTVIGHGSNLLVLDGGIRGLVIRVEKNMRGIRLEGNRLTVTAEKYARMVEITGADGDAVLSDNYFDMLPGQKTVEILRGEAAEWKVRSVFDIR